MKGSRITQTKQTPAYERFKTQHKHKIYQTDSFKTQETPGQIQQKHTKHLHMRGAMQNKISTSKHKKPQHPTKNLKTNSLS